ncbi:hypothetical protein LOTGIDRAFT_173343 [Lottia gigantea]|uniref:Uncharacterized protein n=1 Tax=Lottia gigantea TaxID=225164 RepID=V4A8G2_LOTGI|nr:hypothetical protein LOTGIDRAFT_173343 [Lottia gigantea]ESP00259.1 hypothetical protein LOTGIDRAFT_173343 [Lottia gigantea]
MDKECLYTALKYFIFEARKQNGSEYPANSVDEKGRRYLLYKEDVSKTNHGGLKDSKVPPKEVRAYENNQPSRCYVRLFEKCCSLCEAIRAYKRSSDDSRLLTGAKVARKSTNTMTTEEDIVSTMQNATTSTSVTLDVTRENSATYNFYFH